MAIKSLTITENAYDALKMLKQGDESFSQVILRLSDEKKGLTAKYLGCLKMTDKEAMEWKNRIKQRRAEIEKEVTERSKKIQRMLA